MPILDAIISRARGEQHISELDNIETLLWLYQAKVFRFVALTIRDRDAAESITQDCFLKAHTTRAQFRGDCSVSTWLIRIAFNLIRDHTKSQKFRFWKTASASVVDVDDLDRYLPSGGSSPETQILARERVTLIRKALEDFSEKQRSVFLMRFVEEMELPEIAQVTGMPVQTVKTHLYRAIAAIRAQFGGAL